MSRPPPPAPPGSVVALVAPSGPFEPAALTAATALLEATGLRPRLLADASEASGYLAGPDARRAAWLEQALRDPEVGAVWAIRGGYGAIRLLPLLDPELLSAHAKPLLGLSDTSVLLNAWAARAGVVTYHGPVARGVPDLDIGSRDDLRAFWAGAGVPDRHELQWVAGALAEGPLYGGNLASLVSLVGTPWLPDLKGAILFVEDVHEPPYRLDRMFRTLFEAGILGDLAGLVLGEFTWEGRPVEPPLDDLRRWAIERGQVLATGLRVGHGERNTVLPVGARARLERRASYLEILPPDAP